MYPYSFFWYVPIWEVIQGKYGKSKPRIARNPPKRPKSVIRNSQAQHR